MGRWMMEPGCPFEMESSEEQKVRAKGQEHCLLPATSHLKALAPEKPTARAEAASCPLACVGRCHLPLCLPTSVSCWATVRIPLSHLFSRRS